MRELPARGRTAPDPWDVVPREGGGYSEGRGGEGRAGSEMWALIPHIPFWRISGAAGPVQEQQDGARKQQIGTVVLGSVGSGQRSREMG